MKKVVLLIALALGSMTTFAQSTPENSQNQSTTATESESTYDTQATESSQDAQATQATQDSQDSYKEISTDELPEAVSTAVEKNYPTATINKAYMNDANEYKLEVSLQDGTAGTLYADEDGNWIQ